MRHRCTLALLAGCLALAPPGCGGTDEATPKQVNEACAQDSECADAVCHAGLCASPSPKDNGQACAGNGECKSYNCSGALCVAGVTKETEACRASDECVSLNCEAGKCTLKKDAAPCASNVECAGGICYAKKCAKKCTAPSDCGTNQDCGSDDGKRLFCYDRTYKKEIGTSCAVSGSCPGGRLKCMGTLNDPGTVCTDECKTDMDCPSSFSCQEASDAKKYCFQNHACSSCLHDGQCAGDDKCIAFGGGKHCLKPCTSGSTECPMWAECKAAGGAFYCQHKNGKCKDTGKLCDPCSKTEECQKGGMCLTFNLTHESFCGTDCTSSGTCSSGYKCYSISSGKKQCGPDAPSSDKMPTCTSGLTVPIMNKGDLMDDFAMAGKADSDGDNDLSDETLKVVKLSDFKDKKIILFNISAFW